MARKKKEPELIAFSSDLEALHLLKMAASYKKKENIARQIFQIMDIDRRTNKIIQYKTTINTLLCEYRSASNRFQQTALQMFDDVTPAVMQKRIIKIQQDAARISVCISKLPSLNTVIDVNSDQYLKVSKLLDTIYE